MKKIVVIDDEVDFCTLVKLQCIKAGVTCCSANSLNEGLALVNDVNPDVLILDNNLPDGSGWANAGYLLASHPNTILHLVTAENKRKIFYNYQEIFSPRLIFHHKPLSLFQLQEIIA